MDIKDGFIDCFKQSAEYKDIVTLFNFYSCYGVYTAKSTGTHLHVHANL